MFNTFEPSDSPFGESLPQQIYRYILKKIIARELNAGDKIVEEEIAKELNTSRAPVREALYLLQVEGIVERLPRRGTIVKPFTQTEIEDYNSMMAELLRVAVMYGQQRWTPEYMQSLKQYAADADAACEQGNVREYEMKAERVLRHVVVVASNAALAKFYEKATLILNIFVEVRWTEAKMKEFHPPFKQFVSAILAGEFEQAQSAIYAFMTAGIR
ncbi:GntR family transcriptional regulator [Paenibacillus glycanilyticus]|uniref:GntR family transcriptional regulator n=1 Tax=Paenibacillus glycanilyticus TaxID=126569 RepID=A0ABQ6GH92_9BACL|nr:GntR family transcriptional regulator [Paenibacillus glycanilyticus]GLX69870.1 GntR family transcriptional regulator [Paenibacillus glycanilyticus]